MSSYKLTIFLINKYYPGSYNPLLLSLIIIGNSLNNCNITPKTDVNNAIKHIKKKNPFLFIYESVSYVSNGAYYNSINIAIITVCITFT